MKVNTKIRYGIRAMVEIAKADQKSGIFQKEISQSQKISNKYLDHIIPMLKTAGLIANVKGKKSGYHLTRNPSEVTMLQIHNAFEPEIAVNECLSEHFQCEMENICHTNPFWKGLNNLIVQYFASVTLTDLINGNDFNVFQDSINSLDMP